MCSSKQGHHSLRLHAELWHSVQKRFRAGQANLAVCHEVVILIKCCCFKADGAVSCVLTMCLKKTHNACVRHARKLDVRLILTFQVTQVLLDSLDECRVSLAPALMSSPAAASHIVNVVCHCCTCFTLASRGTGCCLQLSNDCLNYAYMHSRIHSFSIYH